MAVTENVPRTRAPRAASSASWRSMWRIHFYAGVFAFPVLLMLAVTGLVILYTDTVNEAQFGDRFNVASSEQVVSYDDQYRAVAATYPGAVISSFSTPSHRGRPAVFSVTPEGSEEVRNVYVDPSNGKVLGDLPDGAGLVGLANRLHGVLNLGAVTVPLPMLAGILGDGAGEDGGLTAPIEVGSIVVEVASVWALVLVLTGLVLWWPRKRGAARARLLPRRGTTGRARWRDLHATAGAVLSVMLVFLVMTGLPWSRFWGANYAFAASRITPNTEDLWAAEAPPSNLPKVGDLDRSGHRIAWANKWDTIPSSELPASAGSGKGGQHGGSGAGHHGGSGGGTAMEMPADVPARASLDLVAAAAAQEGALPGATIALPTNEADEGGAITYGSFTVSNPWPTTMAEQQVVFLDQFTGATLGKVTAADWGLIQRVTEFGVQTHMGTQLGLVSRIVMTVACVLLIWSILSGGIMYLRRRRRGLGFPRRPVDARLPGVAVGGMVVLGVLFPLWGVSALLVIVVDRLVVRRVGPLRRAFGMRGEVGSA